MQVITQKQVEQVAGAQASTCTYGGTSYSQGAVVSIGGGYSQTCQLGGTWSLPFKLQ